VNQQPVTKAHLSIYRQRVRERIEKNKDKPAWPLLKAEWGRLVAEAASVIEESSRGTPMPSFKRTTAYELVRLGNAVEAEDVIETVLSMYLLHDAEPKVIKSHIAFLTQMVRRVRGLTTLNAGTWTDANGKTKTAYREVGPKVVQCLGMKLANAFGPVGLTLARLERHDHDQRLKELAEFRQAISDIQ
jgi:hypothetical protein